MRSNELHNFLSKFVFRKELQGYFGIERERFLANEGGLLVPRAQEFLESINDPRWTYELSACQVEDRTGPQKDAIHIEGELLQNDNTGYLAAVSLELQLVVSEVAPADMPLDIYPEPRYLTIARNISREKLSAACRVAGTHIHIGVGGVDEALRVHNALAAHVQDLCETGDHSGGERLRLYRTMADHPDPPIYENMEHFFETAQAQNFADNPRNCWHLVRISAKGTVECRMFGATPHIDEVIHWTDILRSLLKSEAVNA